jgi:glutamine synthetase
VTRDEVIAEIEERGVRFIRLWFTDIVGQLKSFAVTRDAIAHALDHGIGFDGSSITGFNAVEESDMIALPDPATFTVLPYRPQEDGSVARMFCDVQVPGGAPYEGDPRYVLRRAVDRARQMGFETYSVSPELEFFYFRNPGGTEPLDRGGYFDLTTLDAASDVRRETVLALEAMGIQIAYSYHEGGPSQHEIDMRATDAMTMADNVMTYRTVVKEVALKHGYYATFMPKPLDGENGNGMHTHQNLVRDGQDAFFDPDDPHLLSPTARSFIAGQLLHAQEISCVFAQWVNSYKRLVPGYEAPVYVAWSRRNRSAMIRVAGHSPGPGQPLRVEIRSPDPACNPYLTFAALLHAGLDGIEKGYELPDPMDMNLYDLSHEEQLRAGIAVLPGSLGDAIELGAESELLLRSFGEHIHERFVDIKRAEWEDYRVRVTPFELERYLPIL